MSDFSTKKLGLQLLVTNEILTQEECDRCIEAILNESEKGEVISKNTNITNNDEYDFDDGRVAIKFKKIEEVSNLFFGDGISIKFILKNDTYNDICVDFENITINGFTVSNSERFNSCVEAGKKCIDSISFYGSNLSDIDVFSPNDIYSMEFHIKCQDQDYNDLFETDKIFITL